MGYPHSRFHLLLLLLGGGVAINITASLLYFLRGYHPAIFGAWLVSIFVTGSYFLLHRAPTSCASTDRDRSDWPTLLLLAMIFAPLYFARLALVPVQVNSDELAVISLAKQCTSNPHQDLLAANVHFRFPALVFTLYGWIATLMGGITIGHVRVIHAFAGFAAAVASYAFFRLSLPRWPAFYGALLTGSSHAMLGSSRMALLAATAVPIEIAALTLLLRGFQRRCVFWTFLGGVVTGLSFYTYFPTRILVCLWVLFLLIIWFRERRHTPGAVFLKLGGVSLLGWVLVVTPIILWMVKVPPGPSYARQQLLIFPEGRELQRGWTGSSTAQEGVKRNILSGLSMFNSREGDHGWLYYNKGYGFVDPLTGVLLWIGILGTLLSRRSTRTPGEVLALSTFFTLWFTFCFVVTQAPNYGRMLMIIPFVAYFVLRGIIRIADGLCRLTQHIRGGVSPAQSHLLVGTITAIIVFWNVLIYADYLKLGLAQGHIFGTTARYIEDRRLRNPYTFYAVWNHQYPYLDGFDWFYPMLGYVTGPNQKLESIDPDAFFAGPEKNPPFTMFLSREAWAKYRSTLKTWYPYLQIHPLKPDGSRLALEVW